MVRIVIIVLVLWVIVRIARTLLRPGEGNRRVEATLSRCDHCGLHVPAGEALHDDGHSYCCEAHRQAARSREK